MIEPDLDQAFADGERDQALRRLTRDVELARDLFLVVAGDIVKPTRTCGVVKPPPTLILPIAHCRCRPTAKARRMGASLTAKLSAGASAQLAFGCRSRPRGGLAGAGVQRHPNIALGVFQVRSHGCAGALGIAFADRVEDGQMGSDGVVDGVPPHVVATPAKIK